MDKTPVQEYFEEDQIITGADLREYYASQGEPDLNANTLLSRIYSLKKKGVLASVKRGEFVLGGRPDIKHIFEDDLQELREQITGPFPHIRCCVWSSAAIDRILNREPLRRFTMVETDREAAEPVFDELKNLRQDIFLNPDKLILSRYVSLHENPLIIKSLITEAPLVRSKGDTGPSLEKICVDMISETDTFSVWQGAAMRNFYLTVFNRNVINYSALKRYARRRGREGQLNRLLQQLNLSN